VETGTATLADVLARLALFADLGRPELESIAHAFSEDVFAEGQRVIREGLEGSGFYLILDGEARVLIGGEERARLGRGEFFGEMSLLAAGPPTADVVATTVLRCLVVPGPQLKAFLLEHPAVMLRMLQAEVERLRRANVWPG
jgi:CRP/FNR family transcriptional regulator, cyclic AMP receptor protein